MNKIKSERETRLTMFFKKSGKTLGLKGKREGLKTPKEEGEDMYREISMPREESDLF